MIRKLIILLLTLSVGFGAVLLAPSNQKMRKASMIFELPDEILGWEGKEEERSQQEIDLLASDTDMKKRRYFLSEGVGTENASTLQLLESIGAAIVRSGQDLNGSIHRRERCLVSQGFQGLEVSTVVIPVKNRQLKVRRVKSHKIYKRDEDDEGTKVENIDYYWFVGHRRLTESHWERNFSDMKDRLLGGYTQEWAYFSVNSSITKTKDFDVLGRSENETDQLLRSFVKRIYRNCTKLEELVDADNG